MTTDLPFRLAAEVAAAPWCAPRAFELGLIELAARRGLLAPATRTLWAAIEADIRPQARGLSLDSLRQLRDHLWFPAHIDGRRPLVDVLTATARAHLCWHGDRVGLRDDGERPMAESAGRFRWLSLCLPQDLLVAALATAHGHPAPGEHVTLAPPGLLRLLERGLANIHLHGGAAMSFGWLWTALMGDIRAGLRSLRTAEPDAPPCARNVGFFAVVASAAIARALLASYLQWRKVQQALAGTRAQRFEDYLGRALPDILPDHAWRSGASAMATALACACRSLLDRQRRLSAAELALLYRRIAPLSSQTRRQPHTLDDIRARDPLAQIRPDTDTTLPETRWTCDALAYLRTAGRSDTGFASVFWQYQRVRCQVFRWLVEPGGTAGLDWFQRHYNRIRALRGSLRRCTMASALTLESRDVHLSALEIRTTPASRRAAIRRDVRSYARQALHFEPESGRCRPEVGVVFHFIKEAEPPRTSHRGRERTRHADPHSSVYGCRFGHYSRTIGGQARALVRALEAQPELLLLVRGVDVASSELAVPGWVIAPYMRWVRTRSRSIAAHLRVRQPTWRVAEMHATVHAGEEFRRLLSGLRAIHEPMAAGVIGMGDRLGHAIALGTDVDAWCRTHPVTWQPLDERLDDLLWELTQYRAQRVAADAARVECLRAEITRLGRDLFAQSGLGAALDTGSVEHLLAMHHHRANPDVLFGHLGYPRRIEPQRALTEVRRDAGLALLISYLTCPQVFIRGLRSVRVSTNKTERQALTHLQAWLHGLVAERNITVESNPTSNHLVGALGTLEQHPGFRLSPLPGTAAARNPHRRPRIAVSVNDDDPITFATDLGHEFAHLYFSLLRASVTHIDAIEWLEHARQAGRDASFTCPASSQPALLATLLANAAASASVLEPEPASL